MRELKTALGKLYIGDLPAKWRYEPSKDLEHTFQNVPYKIARPQLLGIQFIRPGADIYAGLGVRFIPEPNNKLKLQILVDNSSEDNGEVFGQDYANSVYKGVLRILEPVPDLLGSGILRFDHAHVHPVNSSQRAFQVCCTYLVKLLAYMPESRSDEELLQIADAIFKEGLP